MKTHASKFFGLLLGVIFISASALANMIYLKYADFDPLKSVPLVPPELKAHMNSPFDKWHFFVQFKDRKTDQDEYFIEALGLRIDGYIPDNTLMIEARWADIPLISANERVRWVGEIHPAYKLCPELGKRTYQTQVRKSEIARGQYRLTCMLFDNEDYADFVNFALSKGVEVLGIDPIGPRWAVEVRGPLNKAKELVFHDDVNFIEESSEAVLRNEVTRWVIQSNVDGQLPIWNKGLRGENMIVGLIDDALWKNHNVFRDLNNGNIPGPDHRKLVMYSSSIGQNSGHAHGTHTGGTIAGDQEPVTGSTFRNGHASKARIAFTYLGDISGTNLYSKFVAAHNAGARDHSNSWGNDGTTSYISWCVAIDQYSWDYEEGVVAFAVTNTSTLKAPENAKSCLAVGNTQQAPNQHNANTGGTGPTADGRRKPEIWAPGTGIMSASSSNQSGWTSMTGTSMACPAITGACALVRQYFAEGYQATGEPSNRKHVASGSLIRAMIMNSGVDMTGLSGYPGNKEGWGRLLLDRGLYFRGDPRGMIAADRRRTNGVAQDQEMVFKFNVVNPAHDLKITLTFNDYPGQVNSSNPVVNDIDLIVIAPNGDTYLGNQINTTAQESVTGGTPDTKNSTEMVILKTPPFGSYTVIVKGTKINQGGKQGFGLVVTGGVMRGSSSGPSAGSWL